MVLKRRYPPRLMLSLDIGGQDREAICISGNHSDNVLFAYTLKLGDQVLQSSLLQCRQFKTNDERSIIPVYQYRKFLY
jgi:hypothetical protein